MKRGWSRSLPCSRCVETVRFTDGRTPRTNYALMSASIEQPREAVLQVRKYSSLPLIQSAYSSSEADFLSVISVFILLLFTDSTCILLSFDMDGLSSASAVFAVASIAFQLGDGVNKLLKLYSAIQDAPARIAAIFEDLSLLSQVLAEAQSISYGSKFYGITERALGSCNATVRRLQLRIEKSGVHLNSSSILKRKWSSLQIALSKNEIAEIRTSIDQTLGVLSIAQISSLS